MMGCGLLVSCTSAPSVPASLSPQRVSGSSSGLLSSAPEPSGSIAALATEAAAPTVDAVTSSSETLDCEATLFALRGRTLVACGAQLFAIDETSALARKESFDTGLNLSDDPLAPTRVAAMAGRWPDAAWALTLQALPDNNSQRLQFFRWRRNRWLPSGAALELGGAEAWVAFPWPIDGLAALAASAFGPTRAVTATFPKAPFPHLTAAVQSNAEREEYPCHHALIAPQAWASLGVGDVMVFSGQLCGPPLVSSGSVTHGRYLGYEHFRHGETHGQLGLIELPQHPQGEGTWTVHAAAALSANEVFVAAQGTGLSSGDTSDSSAHFVRWDGLRWRDEPAPFTVPAALWGIDGKLWAKDSQGKLWLRRRNQWARLVWEASPDDGAVSQVAKADSGHFWLVRRQERPNGDVVSRISLVRLTSPP